MAARDSDSRSLVAQIAAAERWGRTPDRTAATAPARAGLRAKFAREIDPEGKLDASELERRVDSLMRAHMLRMTLAAKAARKARSTPPPRRDDGRRRRAAAEATEMELVDTTEIEMVSIDEITVAGGPDAAA